MSLLIRTAPGFISSDGGALNAYHQRYLSSPGFSLDGMTIGVYQHSSVSRDILVELIAALGGTAVSLGRSNFFVPVDTEALRSEDVALGRKWVSEQKLDAIVSTDGDADRPLIADERGEFLRGDVVGILTAARLGATVVVTPVTSTSAVEASGLFARTGRTRVGSPFVIETMQNMAEVDSVVVGFEANGGVMLGSQIATSGIALAPLPTRDAVLPILAVLSLARRANKTISALVGDLPCFFTASDRLKDVHSSASDSLLARLCDPNQIGDFTDGFVTVESIDKTDGVRLRLSGQETLHFRASGNAPELRCYAEAASQARAFTLLDWGLRRAAFWLWPQQ